MLVIAYKLGITRTSFSHLSGHKIITYQYFELTWQPNEISLRYSSDAHNLSKSSHHFWSQNCHLPVCRITIATKWKVPIIPIRFTYLEELEWIFMLASFLIIETFFKSCFPYCLLFLLFLFLGFHCGME